MKTRIIIPILLLLVFGNTIIAQDDDREKFGKTLNLSAGIGYYGYVGRSLPVVLLNYEIDIFRNFTIAPFVGYYSYKNDYYWGDPTKPGNDPSYRPYTYRETYVPIGAKGSYYFDELFNAGPKWDFYAAGSLGFLIKSVVWENGYNGDQYVSKDNGPLYMDVHIGAEYHMRPRTGLFLDLSSGVSTIGLAFHLNKSKD